MTTIQPSPLQSNVLVLNKFYTAIKLITARRAFVMLAKNHAEVITKTNGHFSSYNFGAWIIESANNGCAEDEYARTPTLKIKLPRVIRLFNYNKYPKRDLKFNRLNIIARDNNQCQYCGKKLLATSLSIDHIIPRSRGGKYSWTNAVACCSKCNTKKGGRMPDEAGMKLLKKPVTPSYDPFLKAKLDDTRYQLWKEFISLD